jgi:lipopolysaccharide biosynthesis glycosyltransferase
MSQLSQSKKKNILCCSDISINRFRNDIRVVHFAGALKPWQLTYNPQNEQLSGNLGGQHEVQREFLLTWWKILYERVWPQLSKNNQVGKIHFVFVLFVKTRMLCLPYLFSNPIPINPISMR